jgi:hypothetical protein
MMVSEDANFKMKGHDQSSQDKDPTLGPGWAYMVASNEYLSYLIKHVHEDEVRNMSGAGILYLSIFRLLIVSPSWRSGRPTINAPKDFGHRG